MHTPDNFTPGLVREVVARVLDLPKDELREEVPLSRFGFDSMAAVEVLAELESHCDRVLEDADLPPRPTLEDLIALVNTSRPRARSFRDPFSAMRDDARLPDEIRPHGSPRTAPPRSVVLTGATGFLGAFTLAELLAGDADLQVLCLVRCADASAGKERLRTALLGLGLSDLGLDERVEVLPANLALPDLGLERPDRSLLVERTDAIVHLAAAVNWVAPYAALRAINVRATRELLRLACEETSKPFHFLSSAAVCYAHPGPDQVREGDDMMPHLETLHLGYARSKCVAEALVRDAACRGLPTTILRSTLICGASSSGQGNPGDFMARLWQGCVELAAAPDLDWQVDACPVDFVSRVLGRRVLGAADDSVALHLLNPARRPWREVVLWMNLYGYPMRLMPFSDWLERLNEQLADDPTHPLQSLRGFFELRPLGPDQPTLAELYEEPRRARARDEASHTWLEERGLRCPRVGARELERQFGVLVASRHLPPPPPRPAGAGASDEVPDRLDAAFFARHLGPVSKARRLSLGSDHSILTELASWAFARAYGLFHYRVRRHPGTAQPRPESPDLDLMVKVKPHGDDLLTVARQVTQLCDPALGEAYGRHCDSLGFGHTHLRELALYGETDERFRRHSPRCFARVADAGAGQWMLLLEHLEGTELLDSVDDVSGWQPVHLEAAVEGLASLHGIWLGRDPELGTEPWIGPVLDAQEMVTLHPLWTALERFSRQRFSDLSGTDLAPLRRGLVDTLHHWWPELECLPRTLIHNDCNPRNLCFRPTASGPVLIAYDWELATLHVPQHDLAELLCFVLPANVPRRYVERLLDLHRRRLAAGTGADLPEEPWRRGFLLSLADLMVHRLPFYAVVDTFRPQTFLPRVLRTWSRLYDLFGPLEEARRA